MEGHRRLKITDNLLMLEKGKDEILLADYVDLRPLYVKKGREYIAHFLRAASELGSYERIREVFPHEVALLDTLLDRRIIVPCARSSAARRRERPSEASSTDRPGDVSLFLLISQSCNMGCVYCLDGVKTYRTDQNLRMGEDVAFRSIERCLDGVAPGGCLEVVFFGGEPLLNWPLAKAIITHCEDILRPQKPEKAIKYHLTSNLSLFPADLIGWAKKYNMTFLCDVDGPEPIHNRCRPFKNGGGSHGIIKRNIGRLAAAGLKVNLRATITVLNQDHLSEIAQHHKDIGGNSSAFVPVNPINSDQGIMAERLLPSPRKIIKGMTDVYRSRVWKEEDLYPFNQYAPRLTAGARTTLGCGAPSGNTLVVDVNGDVYPCIYLVGIRRFHMGNMMNESNPNRDLLRWMCDRLHVDHMDECRSCPWRYVCGGGCPLRRLTAMNSTVTVRLGRT